VGDGTIVLVLACTYHHQRISESLAVPLVIRPGPGAEDADPFLTWLWRALFTFNNWFSCSSYSPVLVDTPDTVRDIVAPGTDWAAVVLDAGHELGATLFGEEDMVYNISSGHGAKHNQFLHSTILFCDNFYNSNFTTILNISICFEFSYWH